MTLGPDVTLVVEPPAVPVFVVAPPGMNPIVLTPVPGPPGEPGPPGVGVAGAAHIHTQTTPAATWTITHPLGRLPTVGLYIGGDAADTDATATATTVVLTFAAPTAGTAVLT